MKLYSVFTEHEFCHREGAKIQPGLLFYRSLCFMNNCPGSHLSWRLVLYNRDFVLILAACSCLSAPSYPFRFTHHHGLILSGLHTIMGL